MKGFFVTGTDTGIGKTVVSACLLNALCRKGLGTAYMKPVQTGCLMQDGLLIAPDPDYVYGVNELPWTPTTPGDYCPIRFPLPASPHLAAAREGAPIEVEHIITAYHRLCTVHEALIVEGAGGVMVPLNDECLMIDLIQRIGLPVVLVCRSGLGTLNHTLLTLDALKQKRCAVAGCVMVDAIDDADSLVTADNEETIARWGSVPLLARIPYDRLTADDEMNRTFIAEQGQLLEKHLIV